MINIIEPCMDKLEELKKKKEETIEVYME